MNKKTLTFFAIFILILFSKATFVSAGQTNSHFSADMVTTTGEHRMEAKLFSSKDKTRVETPQSIMITRMDKNVAWILMPAQGMYMEQPIDPNMLAKTSKDMPGEIERVSMGTESVDGKPAQKYKVTYTQDGRKDSMLQWIGDSEIPLKMQAIDGTWTVEYKNVSTSPQPDSLFEVPAGLQKFSMPSMPSGVFPSDKMDPGQWTDEN